MIIGSDKKIITTVQCVPERLEYIMPIASKFNAIIHLDYQKKNAFYSFRDMLMYDFEEFRFHIQDDAETANDLESELPSLCRFMKSHNIHALTLFTPERPSVTKQFNENKRIIPYKNYVGNIGIIFSLKFVEAMRSHVFYTKFYREDDFFIQEVANKFNMPIYAHLPNLVQHKVEMGSILGHDKYNHEMISNLYDPDYFIKKRNNNQTINLV